MRPADHRRAPGRRQRGAVAIEFAALFLVFFTMVYAIIGYSLPLLLTLSFKQLSAEAARSAVRVSPDLQPGAYMARISRQIQDVVDSSWLPANWVEGGCPPPADEPGWTALPAPAGQSFGHYRKIRSTPPGPPRYQLDVCVQRPYGRKEAIIPTLSLFGVDIPALPQDARGETVLRGRSTIRL